MVSISSPDSQLFKMYEKRDLEQARRLRGRPPRLHRRPRGDPLPRESASGRRERVPVPWTARLPMLLPGGGRAPGPSREVRRGRPGGGARVAGCGALHDPSQEGDGDKQCLTKKKSHGTYLPTPEKE